jgi:hypothetical protein
MRCKEGFPSNQAIDWRKRHTLSPFLRGTSAPTRPHAQDTYNLRLPITDHHK